MSKIARPSRHSGGQCRSRTLPDPEGLRQQRHCSTSDRASRACNYPYAVPSSTVRLRRPPRWRPVSPHQRRQQPRTEQARDVIQQGDGLLLVVLNGVGHALQRGGEEREREAAGAPRCGEAVAAVPGGGGVRCLRASDGWAVLTSSPPIVSLLRTYLLFRAHSRPSIRTGHTMHRAAPMPHPHRALQASPSLAFQVTSMPALRKALERAPVPCSSALSGVPGAHLSKLFTSDLPQELLLLSMKPWSIRAASRA